MYQLASVSDAVILAWVGHDGAFTLHKISCGVSAPEEKVKENARCEHEQCS